MTTHLGQKIISTNYNKMHIQKISPVAYFLNVPHVIQNLRSSKFWFLECSSHVLTLLQNKKCNNVLVTLSITNHLLITQKKVSHFSKVLNIFSMWRGLGYISKEMTQRCSVCVCGNSESFQSSMTGHRDETVHFCRNST